MEYGYIRVSTKEQNEQRQVIGLRAFGIEERHIYMGKQSGPTHTSAPEPQINPDETVF